MSHPRKDFFKPHICTMCKCETKAPVVSLTVRGKRIFHEKPHCRSCADEIKELALEVLREKALRKGIQTNLQFAPGDQLPLF